MVVASLLLLTDSLPTSQTEANLHQDPNLRSVRELPRQLTRTAAAASNNKTKYQAYDEQQINGTTTCVGHLHISAPLQCNKKSWRKQQQKVIYYFMKIKLLSLKY